MKKLSMFTLSILLGFSSSLAMANTQAKADEKAMMQQPMQMQMHTTSTEANMSKPMMQNPNSVNINTASAAEIQDKLVGIGAKKAQAIVDYRMKNGNFASVEQLTEVSGIGKATLDKNRDRIMLQ